MVEFVDLDSRTALDQSIEASKCSGRLIICGDKEQRSILEENAELSDLSSEKILTDAAEIDVSKWFIEKRAELEEDWEMELSENEGEWPGEIVNKQDFTLTSDVLSGKLLDNLTGIKLSSDEAWKVIAQLKFGGWNDCPNPEEHCAIWKYWEEKYGAKIIGVSSDIIEAYVTNPPKSKEEAMELAWEQYLYCYDIVEQGVETVSNLGASVLNHKFWYFWWD